MVHSEKAELIVDAPPRVELEPPHFMPERQVAYSGASIHMTVNVTGAKPLRFLWFRDGLPIVGAPDSPLLELKAVSQLNAGSYECKISNELGVCSSGKSSLTVLPMWRWNALQLLNCRCTSLKFRLRAPTTSRLKKTSAPSRHRRNINGTGLSASQQLDTRRKRAAVVAVRNDRPPLPKTALSYDSRLKRLTMVSSAHGFSDQHTTVLVGLATDPLSVIRYCQFGVAAITTVLNALFSNISHHACHNSSSDGWSVLFGFVAVGSFVRSFTRIKDWHWPWFAVMEHWRGLWCEIYLDFGITVGLLIVAISSFFMPVTVGCASDYRIFVVCVVILHCLLFIASMLYCYSKSLQHRRLHSALDRQLSSQSQALGYSVVPLKARSKRKGRDETELKDIMSRVRHCEWVTNLQLCWPHQLDYSSLVAQILSTATVILVFLADVSDHGPNLNSDLGRMLLVTPLLVVLAAVLLCYLKSVSTLDLVMLLHSPAFWRFYSHAGLKLGIYTHFWGYDASNSGHFAALKF